jgi:hypothetical protein
VSLLCETELVVRTVSVRPSDLVLLRHHLEASEGLGFVIARRGGDVLLVATKSREAELDEFIADMTLQFEVRTRTRPGHQEALLVAL